ncbi:MAG: tetratricopeptide repeat protein [Opitutaceae bacterium]|nr:tetratricopeptide repeat protein [Opitutaceae bacterium]
MKAASILLLFALTALLRAAPASSDPAEDRFAHALELKRQRRYQEARTALEAFVTGHPNHAAACHELGLIWRSRTDNEAFEQAVKWLGRAVELEPQNPRYLGDYGGTSLQFASRTRSLSAATRGREAMEKAVALAPDYLDARQGLFEYYRQAPWPLGSAAKANAHLEEIRKRDPDRALLLSVNAKVAARDFDGGFKICEEILAKKPDDYAALYYYGRTASLSGRNLEPGLAALKKCLTLVPPTPASPSHSNVWNRIGTVLEKLGRLDEARPAYESALKLDAGNTQSADALARLGVRKKTTN